MSITISLDALIFIIGVSLMLKGLRYKEKSPYDMGGLLWLASGVIVLFGLGCFNLGQYLGVIQ